MHEFNLSHLEAAKLIVTLHESLGIPISGQSARERALSQRLTLLVYNEEVESTFIFGLADMISHNFWDLINGDRMDVGVNVAQLARVSGQSQGRITKALEIAGFLPLEDQRGVWGRSYDCKVVDMTPEDFEYLPGAWMLPEKARLKAVA